MGVQFLLAFSDTNYSDHGLVTVKLHCPFSEATLLLSHICLDSLLASTQYIVYDGAGL